MRTKNLKTILTNKSGRITGSIAITILLFLEHRQLDRLRLIGNFWKTYAYTHLISYMIMTLLFGLFVAGSTTKRKRNMIIQPANQAKGRLGWLLGVIIAGCPTCSITLASYMGLASLLSLLPFGGIELTFLSIGLLIRVNYTLIRDLNTCSRKRS